MTTDDKPRDTKNTRMGGGGKPVPADDPRDESVEGEGDASEKADKATPPTEGPAAAGSLPG